MASDISKLCRSTAEEMIAANIQWRLDPRYIVKLCDSVESQALRIAELEADVTRYQGLLDAAIDDYNNARNTTLEESAKLSTTCITPADRCKCSTAYEVAAAIRSLIPEKKEG